MVDKSTLCRLCNAGIAEYAAADRITRASLAVESEKAIHWGYVALALCMLFGSAILGIALRRRFPAATVNGINSICAGMFLSMALFHVLPEAAEGSTYWPFFTAFGYLLVLFVDRVVAPHDHSDPYAMIHKKHTGLASPHIGNTMQHETYSVNDGGLESTQLSLPTRLSCFTDEENPPAGREHGSDTRHDGKNASVALVVALSIHSIFEGLAVGSSLGSAMLLLAGVIAAHKWAAAFALTSFVAEDGVAFTRWQLSVLAIFIVASPVGAIVGLIASASDDIAAPVTATAGGTLLFVAMTEVIPTEFQGISVDFARRKFGFMVLGMAAVLALLTFFSEDDAGGHENAHDEDGDKFATAIATISAMCVQQHC
eukprot:GEMP01012321.1.p1 GENE.GEMP01012321.1~~GEMP01012321.1.p1  ORF type:complete len:370 (-),score=107.02 GEMP01012321.1:1980-3089(-)